MIKIRFVEPKTQAWRAWRLKCQAEQALLTQDRQQGVNTLVKKRLYRGQGHEYLGLHSQFSGKCAYCESLFDENHVGDIDHYRPANRVRDYALRVVKATSQAGNVVCHPGYYWLAYAWENLLPACEDCNRPGRRKTPQRIGKWDHFPVRGTHAVEPGRERYERPLLLNPTRRDPSKHLVFDKTGLCIALTKEGKECEKVFGLNTRESLVLRRKQEYDRAQMLIDRLALNDNPAIQAEAVGELERYVHGKAAFSAAGRAGIKDALSKYRRLEVFLSDAKRDLV